VAVYPVGRQRDVPRLDWLPIGSFDAASEAQLPTPSFHLPRRERRRGDLMRTFKRLHVLVVALALGACGGSSDNPFSPDDERNRLLDQVAGGNAPTVALPPGEPVVIFDASFSSPNDLEGVLFGYALDWDNPATNVIVELYRYGDVDTPNDPCGYPWDQSDLAPCPLAYSERSTSRPKAFVGELPNGKYDWVFTNVGTTMTTARYALEAHVVP
jgi:hypothetical protein